MQVNQCGMLELFEMANASGCPTLHTLANHQTNKFQYKKKAGEETVCMHLHLKKQYRMQNSDVS